jgi:hypothetical protein
VHRQEAAVSSVLRRTVAFLVLLATVMVSPVWAVSTTIVISEFRTRGPNGANDELIELYNMSGSSVAIGSWTVRGSNNAGSTSIRATIPAGTSVGPGCHYLLTNSSASGGPYSGAVAGNQTYAVGITDDGGIAVLDAAAVIIDAVGMSAGSAYLEGAILAPLTTNVDRGYERKPGGAGGSGQDADDNATDFQLVTPSLPQNLASTCIAATPTRPSTWGQVKTIYR